MADQDVNYKVHDMRGRRRPGKTIVENLPPTPLSAADRKGPDLSDRLNYRAMFTSSSSDEPSSYNRLGVNIKDGQYQGEPLWYARKQETESGPRATVADLVYDYVSHPNDLTGMVKAITYLHLMEAQRAYGKEPDDSFESFLHRDFSYGEINNTASDYVGKLLDENEVVEGYNSTLGEGKEDQLKEILTPEQIIRVAFASLILGENPAEQK